MEHEKDTETGSLSPNIKVKKLKKPCGPYILFGKEHRKKIVQAHPGLKNKEIMSAIGEAWNNLPMEEKEVYKERASKEREYYEKECIGVGIRPKGMKQINIIQPYKKNTPLSDNNIIEDKKTQD